MFSLNLNYWNNLIQSNLSIRLKLKKLFQVAITALLCMATIVSCAVATAETQIIPASKDNTLIENATGELSNGVGPVFFVGRTNHSSNSIRRGLITFDVAQAIPAGSTITEVQLTLILERTAGDKESIELHRVLADWGEGSSSTKGGRGAPATKGDATWIHTFYDTDLWSQPGGDFSADISAKALVGGEGSYIWGSTPEMVADVQLWLDSPDKNFGWLLLGNEKSSGTAKAFASRHITDASIQPQLSVSFEPSS